MNNKPWRVIVCLDDIAKFRVCIFEPCRWVLLDGGLEEIVEYTGLGLLVAASFDIECKVKKFRDVLSYTKTSSIFRALYGDEIRVVFLALWLFCRL